MADTPREDNHDVRAVPVVWVDVDEQPVHPVNQYIAQATEPGQVVLTLGHVVPPALLGSEDERREQLKQVSYIPVRVVARVSLTPQRLDELAKVLQDAVDIYRRMYGENDGRTEDSPS